MHYDGFHFLEVGLKIAMIYVILGFKKKGFFGGGAPLASL